MTELSNKDRMIARELARGKSVDRVARENSMTPRQVEEAYDRAIRSSEFWKSQFVPIK
jgi:hypothetical protein